MDILLEANQPPAHHYSMDMHSYSSAFGAGFDNTTATGLVIYHGFKNVLESPIGRRLPPHNRTEAATEFTKQFRSLASKDNPIKVPKKVDTNLLFTISVNLLNCTSDEPPCKGPLGKRFAAGVNNISLVLPNTDFLSAYYKKIPGVFEMNFPRKPERKFNYTADKLPEYVLGTDFGSEVLVLEYNASVEVVLQGTRVVVGDNHPVHFHGYSFYVVGWGFGNFDPKKDPDKYNLVDPPQETTVGVPKNGWVAIRFRADNPGVWFVHCHLERHASWRMGMGMVLW
ncbi:hypothetical protein PIB30_065885 [Stylosanthes scabra]|uniref:Plastocyanin-like domain-containing protein n=1 Tax=Stylosanthes scabra TaxID=79078 RepID=A0ABU6VNZ7_9FABA|nr:hypothetical protein [Stylosanthes scabra]